MYVCQWHLDLKYGTQGDAIRAMKAWGEEKMRSSEFKRVKSSRLLVGHVGPSASHVAARHEGRLRAVAAASRDHDLRGHRDARGPGRDHRVQHGRNSQPVRAR